jgi:5-methylcytosine-specific restriction endonuclease McrA
MVAKPAPEKGDDSSTDAVIDSLHSRTYRNRDAHHKDGNHENDNSENIQTLCANCRRLITKQEGQGMYRHLPSWYGTARSKPSVNLIS